jgi:ABC-type uncharacterized transport system permease subunit
MTFVAHICAAGLYALAGAFAVGPAAARRFLAWFLAGGSLVHTLGLLGLHLQEPAVPLESTAAALSLIGWLAATSYLLSLLFARTIPVGLWVGLAAAILTVGAAFGLRFGSPPPPNPEGGAWSHAHVLLSTAGVAVLGLSALFSGAYLAKERALKLKAPSSFELPSLERLDRLEYVMLSIGFPLLTLGVLTGYAWVFSHGGDPWTPHANFTLAAWVIFLLPLSQRVIRHEQGLRVSRSMVLGFLVLAFCYLGVRLLGGAA